MGLQTSVNIYNTLGFPGDLAFDGPIRSETFILNSSGQAQNVGYAYTRTNGGASPSPSTNSPVAGTAQVGGTGVFAGILVNPKVYPLNGNSSSPLNPSLVLPDNAEGELLYMGEIFVALPGAANDGDLVYYDNTTGALGSTPSSGTATGSIAAGGAGAQDVLTVTGTPTVELGVGSTIAGAGILPGTVIVALGTGTGGAGTYKLNSINLQTVSSEALTVGGVAPSGKTLVPTAKVARYVVSGSTVNAVIRLTV